MNNVKRSKNKKWNIRAAILLVFTILCVCGMIVHAEKYEYDELNRVKKVTYDDGSYVEYAYDANGNILSIAVHQDECGTPGADHKHMLVKHERVEATADTSGNIEYWECTDCGKLFADAEGRVEIQPEDIVIPIGSVAPNPETEIGIYISFDEDTITKKENGIYEAVYTGSAVKPGVVVKNNGKLLIEGVDYKLKYSNNVNCTTKATVLVSGKGKFSGHDSLNFSITKKDIGDSDVYVGETITEKGKAANPAVIYKGTVLKQGRDYVISTNGNNEGGSGKSITISGIGNFSGKCTVNTMNLEKDEYKKATIKVSLSKVQKVYDTNPQTLSESELKVTNAVGTPLTINDDYCVSYSANVDAGTVRVVVAGKGIYRGTVKKTFKISPAKGSIIELIKDQDSYHYIKAGVVPDLEISTTMNGKRVALIQGKDYRISYSANKKPGTGKFKLTFLGNYKGAKYSGNNTFTITETQMLQTNTSVITGDMVYKKASKYQPPVYVIVNNNLLAKNDYQTNYLNKERITLGAGETKTCVVSVNCKSNKYKSSKQFESTYDIVSDSNRTEVSKAKVTIVQGGKKVKGIPYTGRAITFSAETQSEPQIMVKIGKSILSSADVEKNFDIYYADNVEKGKAIIVLKAKADSPYIGVCSGKFSILSGQIGK